MQDNRDISLWRRFRRFLAEKRQAFRQRHPKAFWVLRISFWMAALGIFSALILITSVYLGFFGKIPSRSELKKINTRTASKVYSDDDVLIGKFYLENRVPASLKNISPHVLHALVATEDERFFKHHGVDFRSLARVLVKSILLRKQSGGGSTISQQLAKNIFKRKEKHGILTLPVAKIKEMFIAARLEKIYSKDELLEQYLNTVPFGNRIFGIEVAANRYFGKPAANLELEEAATLVGMLKATGHYNPVTHPQRAVKRRNVVLHQMAKNGYLTDKQLAAAQKKPLKTDYRPEGSNEGLATYFREQVRQQAAQILKNINQTYGTDYNLYTDGLVLRTTIDSRLQRYAEQAVEGHMRRLQAVFDRHWRKRRKPWLTSKALLPFIKQSERYKKMEQAGAPKEKIFENFLDTVHMRIFTWHGLRDTTLTPRDSVGHYLSLLNTGLLAVDPLTQQVKAWVGGIDFKHLKYDHVTSRRQVGSTFKPIVYATALEAGRSPCEYISNDSLSIYDEDKYWTPNNAEGHFGGYYSMSGALAHSVNVAAVRMIVEAGVGPVISLAKKCGIKSPIPKVPSIALGSLECSLEEMVTMYATFARKGHRPHPYFLKSIETPDGKVIFKQKTPAAPSAMSESSAKLITRMLQMVVDSGTARRLHTRYKLSGGIAGKTGTTQGQSDGWFIGYTPRLVMGVWVGGEIPAVRFRSLHLGQGANTALPIWGLTYQKINRNRRLYKYHSLPFPPLSDSLAQKLNCPPFVETLILPEEEEPIASAEEGLLDKVLREHRERMKKKRAERAKRRRGKKKKSKIAKWLKKVFGKKN